MNTLLESLARVCRERLLQEKLLLAPTRRIAYEWLDVLTRHGVALVNVRVETIRSLALRLAAEELAASGLALASAAQQALAVAAAWGRAIDNRPGYLASVQVTGRLLENAGRTISDLRLAGVRSGEISASALEMPIKARDLAALLGAYEAILEERRLVDPAGLLRLATAAAGEGRAGRPAGTLLLVPADLRLGALERRLVESFPPGSILELPVDEPDPRADAAGDLALLARLDAPDRARAPAFDGSVQIVHAVGEINEVRAALRRILSEGVPLEEAELLYTDADTYLPLILEAAQRVMPADRSHDLGVPVTSADGVPASLSRPGRLLCAWLEWIEQGFPQAALVVMLREGLLQAPAAAARRRIAPAALADALRDAPIGFGRARYGPRLRAHADRLADRLRRAENEGDPPAAIARLRRDLAVARALEDLVARLLALTPRRTAPPLALLRGARRLLRGLAHRADRLDGLARDHLLRELRSMEEALRERLPRAGGGVADESTAATAPDTAPAAPGIRAVAAAPEQCAVPAGRGFAAAPRVLPGSEAAELDAWEWLHDLPARLSAAGSGPRPGHLHVAPLRGGGHGGRSFTWILGLDDGRHPPAGLQDPLLLDDERRATNGNLRTARQHVAEERQDFLRLLCRLRGRAVLSFSCRSLVDDRETFASPVILGAFRLLSAQPRGDYEGLRKWLQEPASFAPVTETECLDAAEWWLCRGADRPRVANFAELVAASFANLRRGRAAAAVRAADEFSIFDGRIAAPDARLDPAAPQGPVVSATSLQTLGACPLRYFYRYVLELEPPEPLAPDATRWLDPRQFGQLLHEVLYDLVGGLVADGHWPPDPTRDEPRLRETLERALRRWEEEHPPPGEDAYRRRVEELERSLGAFLRTPPHWEGSQPLYLETSIGLRPQGRGCELDSPDPAEVRLPDGRTIRVRARLDRIDRVGDGRPPTFVVIDYKSGRLSAEHDEADPFRQGRLLQQALYLAVARDALGRRFGQDAAVEGFGFLFAGPNGHGRTIPCGARVIDEGLNRAARLCALAAGGAFPATSDSNDCRLCDFRAACTAVSPDLGALCARSARKIADARNEIVRPFAELRNAC